VAEGGQADSPIVVSVGAGFHFSGGVRAALNEAKRRRHLTENPATIAKAPRLVEEEVVPYTVEEVQLLLEVANRERNAARWVIALALGLHQGEVLGLKWADVDFDLGVLVVHRGRLRPRYQHGCGDTCGRKPGYCPQKVEAPRPAPRRTGPRTPSRTRPLGREGIRLHLTDRRAAQSQHRHHKWKELLQAAGLRDGRLHDARHTAGTILLILGVSDTVVDSIMGWEPGQSARMRRRYQHLTNRVLAGTAGKVGGLLRPLAEKPPVG
jgi:integrase